MDNEYLYKECLRWMKRAEKCKLIKNVDPDTYYTIFDEIHFLIAYMTRNDPEKKLYSSSYLERGNSMVSYSGGSVPSKAFIDAAETFFDVARYHFKVPIDMPSAVKTFLIERVTKPPGRGWM